MHTIARRARGAWRTRARVLRPGRLERFATRLTDPRLREIPAWRRLAEHATSITVADCLALGLEVEALVILEDVFGDLADAPPPVAANAPPLRVALANLEYPGLPWGS